MFENWFANMFLFENENRTRTKFLSIFANKNRTRTKIILNPENENRTRTKKLCVFFHPCSGQKLCTLFVSIKPKILELKQYDTKNYH